MAIVPSMPVVLIDPVTVMSFLTSILPEPVAVVVTPAFLVAREADVTCACGKRRRQQAIPQLPMSE